MPVNNQLSYKKGLEYSIDFGEIKKLYTSFYVDGAWLRTIRVYNAEDYAHLPSSQSATQLQYIGIYPAGESRVSERLNTNLRMITHIPQIRMILTTSFQMIWYDMYYYPEYDEVPLYLIDRNGDILSFEEKYSEDPITYAKYIDNRSDTYYLVEKMDPLWVINLKLSKEITDKVKLSFYVNNFLNYRPMYMYSRSQSYLRRNESIYFGAELKIKI